MNINLKFKELDIVRHISSLPKLHATAFAASCCERAYPNISIFLAGIKANGWVGEDIWRVSIDKIWDYLGGQKFTSDDFDKIADELRLNYPSEYDCEPFTASDRCSTLIESAINFCGNPDNIEFVVTIVEQIHESLFEYIDFLTLDSSTNKDVVDLSIDQLIEMVSLHPITIKEIEKQANDLQKLQEATILTPELLQWLRTSSENGGQSFLGLNLS